MAGTSNGRLVKVILNEPYDGRTEWFFGSMKAIFETLTPEQVGTTLYDLYNYNHARHIAAGNPLVTDRATISYIHFTRVRQQGKA